MKRMQSATRLLVGGLGLATIASLPGIVRPTVAAPQQLSADEAAVVKLSAGRRAFNDKNYSAATAAFKDFLAAHGDHREAAGAWYGLGLCILQTAPIDYPAAGDAFRHAAASQDFPDRPLAQYYLGISLGALGERMMNDAIVHPNDAESLKKQASQKFADAAAQFEIAQASLRQRLTEPPPAAPAALPIDWEWSARARCDQADMLLRLGKFKEALDISRPFDADTLWCAADIAGLGFIISGMPNLRPAIICRRAVP